MREIDFTQPLSDEDIAYVQQRPWLAVNAGIDPASLDDEFIDGDEDDVSYTSMSKAQLVEAAEARGIDSSGTKADIIERLTEADVASGDED